jgi:malate synthase
MPPSSSSVLKINRRLSPAYEALWTAEAQKFVADLVAKFAPRRDELLARRLERQRLFDAGVLPNFLPETAEIRNGDWTVAAIPAELIDRRVEIAAPVDRESMVDALNSGAKVFMADFEDSSSPAWDMMMQGQINVAEAIAGTIAYDPPGGERRKLNEKTAVLMMRPRGWHLPEKNVPASPGRARRFRALFFS